MSQDAGGEAARPDITDLTLPSGVGSALSGECTVMIEVDPKDAALMDYEGISGAIGRLEADEKGVVLDLKGCQYQASLLPGPTALVVGFAKGGELRVEAITDEYATLAKSSDMMKRLDAVVEGADPDNESGGDDSPKAKTGKSNSTGARKRVSNAATKSQQSVAKKQKR